MKRFKPPKTAVSLSRKELNRIKAEIASDTTEKAMLLILAATADTIDMTDDQVCEVYETAKQYGEYIDTHLVRIIDVQNTIEKRTGIKLKGWKR